MSKLIDCLNALHESIDTSSPEELKRACELIIRAQAMTGAERETLLCAFKKGPLWDGDVPSKVARGQLLDEGFMAKIVVKGDDGYNACTYKGAWACRILALQCVQPALDAARDDHEGV